MILTLLITVSDKKTDKFPNINISFDVLFDGNNI